MTDVPPRGSHSDVTHLTALAFGLTVSDLKEDHRRKDICAARFALYTALRRRKGTPSQIGRWVGRDHSSVLNGLKRAEAIAAEVPGYGAVIDFLTACDTETVARVKTACNMKPALVVVRHQQRRKDMDHPEYVESRINSMLPKGISIYWNGDIIERDEPNIFGVLVGDDPNGMEVYDYGHVLSIRDETGEIDEYRTYAGLAAGLVSTIKEDA